MDVQKTWLVVPWSDAIDHQKSTGNKMITSKMFLGDIFDKLKCRIVAGGHQQSFGTYSEVSAPTVDMSSVFMLLSMNKYLQGDISSVDIPMAYLNATLHEADQ